MNNSKNAKWWKRPICWFIGHNWYIYRDAHAWNLMHICYIAGCDATCERCGKEWKDYDAYTMTQRRILEQYTKELSSTMRSPVSKLR